MMELSTSLPALSGVPCIAAEIECGNIYIITGYTDMRKSIDGLCAIVITRA